MKLCEWMDLGRPLMMHACTAAVVVCPVQENHVCVGVRFLSCP